MFSHILKVLALLPTATVLHATDNKRRADLLLVKEDLQEEGKGLDSQEMKEVVEQLEALEARDKQREQTRHQIELERKVNSEDMCSTSVSRTMVTSSKLNDDLESPDMGFEEYTTKHKEKLEAFREYVRYSSVVMERTCDPLVDS